MKERQAVAAWPSGSGDHLVTEEFPFAAVEEALAGRTGPEASTAMEASTATAADICRQRAEAWEAKAASVDGRLAAHRAYKLRAEEAEACAAAVELTRGGDDGLG